MIPLAEPNLCGNESKYLQECVTSTFVSSVGPFVTRFEKMVAEASGTSSSVATSSGTTALHIALVAAGVKSGDLVIVPSFTFIASANAIAHCGATPWLLDINENSWTLDTTQLESELQSQTVKRGTDIIHKGTGKRVSAIMPVYTLGVVAQMDDISHISKNYGIPLVVDAAPALGALYKGRAIGELADLSVFSFNGNKTVTAGAGGAIVGRNQDLLKKARHLSTTARVSLEYDHDQVGYNYRMTNLQAAVGCAQLENLDLFVEAKIKIREEYDRAFRELKGVGLFPNPNWSKSVCWFSGLIIENEALPKVRQICASLKEIGIEARSFWKPIHLQSPYSETPRASLTRTDNIWSKIVTLPASTQLKAADQLKVISAVKEILK